MSAKDYFQDITPPSQPPPRQSPPAPPPPTPASLEPDVEPESRSIRNIPINTTRQRPRIDEGLRESGPPAPRPPKRGASRFWLWGAVIIALLALGAIALVALRPTSVSVVPRSHAILFDETARFTAYPAETAAEGTLAYTTQSSTIDDSQVVAAMGTERVEEKATGSITVTNDYQTAPLKLVANTRFQSASGRIFRTPIEVTVPGKSGNTPGQLSLSVVADQPGETYNVAAGDFTLPGLKGSDMYSKVTAKSTEAMSGGFAGDRPAIDKATEDATRAEIRGRLEQKVRAAIASAPEGSVSFPELTRISYETLPATSESGDNVRMNERARIEMPVFDAQTFASIVARSVSADADAGIRIVPGANFAAVRVTPMETPLSEPLEFTLEGTATLVWNVDESALANALAAKDESAFQSIVQSFPGIEEAHARIEPFWKNSFPSNAASIQITIKEPKGE